MGVASTKIEELRASVAGFFAAGRNEDERQKVSQSVFEALVCYTVISVV